MTDCILHLGMGKTGSTSIQHSLNSSLTDPDFYYADLGHPNHSTILVNAFMDRPEQLHNNHKWGITREQILSERPAYLQRMAEEIGRCGPRTLILSAEAAFNFTEPATKALFAFFSSHACRVQLVSYLRPIRGWMESRFTQTLSEPSPWVPVDRFAWATCRMKYGRFIKTKDDVFGRDRVTLWPFSPGNFPQGCVVQDFCQRIGMKTMPGVIHRSNERLALPAIQFLHAYRTFGPGYGVGPSAMPENANLLRHLKMLPGPRFHFHSELVDNYCRRNEANITWIESRLGASLRDSVGHGKDGHAIRVESDLLAFSAESLEWLAERTGTAFRKLAHGDPSEVAAALHLLRRIPEPHPRIPSPIKDTIRARARAILSSARGIFR